jgi:hypothetical protein
MWKFLKILKENWIKYGFETLVVTVGILGAFALESWRETRQEEKELREVYKTISDNLQTDVLALDTVLIEYEWKIEMLKRILTGRVSEDNWIDNDSLTRSFLGYVDFRENLRGLDLLKSRITIGGETGILAGRISNFYNERLLRNSVKRNEVDDFLYDNLMHWVDNGEWLSAINIERDRTSLAKYAMDNPYFRNRITAYLIVFNGYHKSLERYKEEGAKLAEEIDTFLEEK